MNTIRESLRCMLSPTSFISIIRHHTSVVAHYAKSLIEI